jgi:hypothetical protein
MTPGSRTGRILAAEADLVLAYYSQGKFAQAEPLAREILDIQRKSQPDDWQRFRTESLLGTVLAGQKKYSEAEPLLEEGYRGMPLRRIERYYRPYHAMLSELIGASGFAERIEGLAKVRGQKIYERGHFASAPQGAIL